ncbi:endopeptidase [Achromobacter xylosoxidans]|uniref:Bbp19 family protein n=1 Tax=Alcaligenes xylosoxydans xylosoxydans TaxID=85698 RepID=UPI0012324A9D|nr:endopeptidase [Achromobacter xylosoxidans]KAA5926360.1 endopeptidase [Achromobacter xylosoxidans]
MSTTAYDPLNPSVTETDREAKREDAKHESRVESDDMKWLMGNRRGRRIVWRLLSRAGVYRTSFSTNAMQMAFNEGNRNEGLRLMTSLLLNCPERYAEMLQEQKKHDHRNPSDDRTNAN